MTLNPITHFPVSRRYVLKLHRDAAPTQFVCGRLENMTTGKQFDFRTATELLAILDQELANNHSNQQEPLP